MLTYKQTRAIWSVVVMAVVLGLGVVLLACDVPPPAQEQVTEPVRPAAEEPELQPQALSDYQDSEGYIYKWYCLFIPCVKWPQLPFEHAHPWDSGDGELCAQAGTYPSVQLFSGPDQDGWCIRNIWGGPGETTFGEANLARPGMAWNDKVRSIYAIGVSVLMVFREIDYVNNLVYMTQTDPTVPIQVDNLTDVSSVFVIWGY